MQFFTANDGVEIAYSEEGQGRPVVLLAGYGAPVKSYFSLEGALLQAGRRVVAMDRRSHGESGRPNHGHRLSRHAMDLHELLQRLRLKEKPVLLGHSMGAATIFAYLSLFGDGGIAGAVSIDQTPQMLNTAAWPYGFYGFHKGNMAVFFDNPIPAPTYKDPSPEFMATLNAVAEGLLPFDEAGTKPLLLDHAWASWLDVLPQVRVPFLFIAGANSPFWPCGHAVQAAALCRNGSSVVIPDCGHAVNWEKPAECNAAVLEFLVGL